MTLIPSSLQVLQQANLLTAQPTQHARAFLPFKLTPLALATGGKFQSLDLAPFKGTNLRLATQLPSPRNTKSPYPRERQQEIFEAAELKRQRKEAKRAGIDLDGEL